MSFTITKIEASFNFRLAVKENGVLLTNDIIWSQTHACDPTAIQLIGPQNMLPLFLDVNFTFDFQGQWPVPGSKYYISGAGPDGARVSSGDHEIKAAGPVDVMVTDFKLLAPASLTIPFVEHGNWTWTLGHIPPAGGKRAPEEHFVNWLELYFHPGKCDVIFDQGVEVDLIRMVIPPYNIIYGAGAADVQAAYAYMIKNIFDHGKYPDLKYDARASGGGRSHYITFGPTNNVLHVTNWLRRTIEWLNCQDLANICATACKAFGLQTDDQTPIITNSVVMAEPFGFIPDGPLFGWNIQEPEFQTCNNPFWWTTQGTGGNYPPGLPHIAANSASRTEFSLHMFTQVDNPAGAVNPTIIDACHSVGPAPAGLASGTHDRGTYYTHATQNPGPPAPLIVPTYTVYAPLQDID